MRNFNYLIALSILTLSGTLLNAGCSEDSNNTSTTIQTSFDGSEGKCTSGGVKIEYLVDGVVDNAQTQYICNGTHGQDEQGGQSGTSTSDQGGTDTGKDDQGGGDQGGTDTGKDDQGGSSEECKATFTYVNQWTNVASGGTADWNVYLVGSMNNWEPLDSNLKMTSNSMGTHTITIEVKKGETYEYKFYVEGWDPDNWKSIEEDGESNSKAEITECGMKFGNGQDKIYCHNVLVDPLIDSAHCSICDNTCAEGLTCLSGSCQKYKLDSTSVIKCDGKDVHPYDDPNNCGKCGTVCDSGKQCKGGVCVFNKSATLVCNGNTIQPYYDSANCGECGHKCETGKYCTDNACVAEIASDTSTYCNGKLVYPYEDSANCGGCDNKCATGEYCEAAVCINAISKTNYCNGKLVYPYNDSSNCGGCNVSCSSSQICLKGTCTTIPNVVNGVITFGHYEQDNDTTNGKEPITWRVLDKNAAGQYLIISEKGLTYEPYNEHFLTVTWENSTIRSWLNGYDASYNSECKSYTSDNFIDEAFTAAEKAKIVAVNVAAHANPNCSRDPGNMTTDRIFLLSIIEAETYFTSDADRKVTNTTWWLRTPGKAQKTQSVACVNVDGSIDYDGIIDDLSISVRPALWVNL